jgi:putative lipoprotein
MRYTSDRAPQVVSLVLFIILLFLGIDNNKNLGATSTSKIEGIVWYRERMLPPQDAEVSITLEDVARMDVRAELIAVTRFKPQGGPPWTFTLEYDPAKIHEKGRYALRARVESNGRLIFTSTEHIPAFDRDPGKPLKILVSQVSSTKAKGDAPPPKPNANLTNTYWKPTEVNGEPVLLGAGQKELHMILNAEGYRVKGFSGCNRFTGTYKVEDDHLKFSQMASTGMACLDGMEQEQRFLSALKDTTRFKISGDSLSLYGAVGQLFLRFEAVYLK